MHSFFALLSLFIFVSCSAPTAAPPVTKIENPWSRVATPSEGKAESIGKYAAGCLRGAEQIEADSEGFQIVRYSRNRHFGHPTLVNFLESEGTQVHKAHEKDFVIGDMGMARGGPTLSGHASHQTGLDVDIWYERFGRKLNADERETYPARLLVDPKTHAVKSSDFARDAVKLVRRFASASEVERIFVNPAVKTYLCENHKGENWLTKVRPWYGHDYHFHVRLNCPVGNSLCEKSDPVPAGDGCDATLAWWSSDEAKKQEGPKSTAAPVMPSLPPACEPVLAAQSARSLSRIDRIIQDYTERAKVDDAFSASEYAIEENLSQFGDYLSPEWKERNDRMSESTLAQVRAINPKILNASDLRTYLLFKSDAENEARGIAHPVALHFTQMGNRLHEYIDDTSEALTSFPFDTVAHYDAFLKRSEGFPLFIDRQIKVLEEGRKKGIIQNCILAKAAIGTYRDALEPVTEKNPFYRPIGFMPKSFPEKEQARLKDDFRKMIETRILPGYAKFNEYYQKQYLPHCRQSFGIGAFPQGKKWYRDSILSITGLPLSPDTLFAMGTREVVRIEKELVKAKNDLGFKGTLAEFREAIQKDPKYFFTSAKEMFTAFADVKAKVAAKVPDNFDFIPKADYKIVESSNPSDAAGSYRGPNDTTPFGRFIVNTKSLRSVPVYEVTTLSMHEAVPGHHFQIALQYELKNELSEYQRKMFFSGAFVEGWALYSEYLGNEMGMYTDPMQRLGHLNDEMWRAVRLVVDTGIHARGWSQAKAIAYMKDHTAHDIGDITIEVNRYAAWPAQALSYKVGQLKILELRHLAEKELGARFDLKGFHRAVIGHGTVSLAVLETQVRDWIRSVPGAR